MNCSTTVGRIVVLLFLTLLFAVSLNAQSMSFAEAKATHFGAGSSITMLVGYSSQKPWVGLLSGIGAGVGKEVWDNYHGNETFGAHARDVAITSAGAALGYWIVKKMIGSDRRHAMYARRQAGEAGIVQMSK
jgi:hypothetical protein